MSSSNSYDKRFPTKATIASIIATVIAGLLLAYLLPDRQGSGIAKRPNLIPYHSRGGVFRIDYPPSMEGVKPIRGANSIGCIIGSFEHEDALLGLVKTTTKNAGLQVTVALNNEQVSSMVKERIARLTQLTQPSEYVRLPVEFHLVSRKEGRKDGKTFSHYEIKCTEKDHDYTHFYYLYHVEESKDALMIANAHIGADKWEDLQDGIRASIDSISWSPSAAREVLAEQNQ